MARHSVWNTTPPSVYLTGSQAVGDDGQGITLANGFYLYGGAVGSVVGGRVWVDPGLVSTLTSVGVTGITMYLWTGAGTGVNPLTDLTPADTQTVPLGEGGWVECNWSEPVPVESSDGTDNSFYVGYRFVGNDQQYLYQTPDDGYSAYPAQDGFKLAMSRGGSSFTAPGEPAATGVFRYDNGGSDPVFTWWGADAIVNDGDDPLGEGAIKIGVNWATSLVGDTPTPRTIVEENAQTDGVFGRAWWFDYLSEAIEGFTRSTYYEPGQSMQLSVNSAAAYTVKIFRLGWYSGDGARLVADFSGTPTTQPAAQVIPDSNGALTCKGWSVTDTWQIPSDATPGWYWILLQRGTDFAGIPFVVSDKAHPKRVLLVASDGTWHAAYNGWGGNNVYGASTGIGSIGDRAFASTYDKPMLTRDAVPQTNFFNGELPMIRFLERMGVEVGYTTCEQADADPSIMDGRDVIIFCGHNEYISQRIRDKVESQIAAGTNILNLAGNDFFWRTCYGDESGFAHGSHTGRVMWVRKDTMPGPSTGPDAQPAHVGGVPFDGAGNWGGTWQDTRWANRQPPSELFGDRFIANGIRDDHILVPYEYKTLPIWRDCAAIQALTEGQTWDAGAGTLGMEWDMPDDSEDALPTALLSESTVTLTNNMSDLNGEDYGLTGTVTHAIQMVRNGNAYIANFNTTQWAWALDDLHDRGTSIAKTEALQATLNVLYDLGALADAPSITAASLVEPTPVADIDAAYGIPDSPGPDPDPSTGEVAMNVNWATSVAGQRDSFGSVESVIDWQTRVRGKNGTGPDGGEAALFDPRWAAAPEHVKADMTRIYPSV